MNLDLIISVDDVNPQLGWRILGDKTEKWFKQLNDEFGIVFNLFVPSNYHAQFPLSEHKAWVNELNAIPYFSLEAHGHYHQTTDPKQWGECEFAEIQDFDLATDRISEMWDQWFDCDVMPRGFRPPGWLISPQSAQAIEYFRGKYYEWGMWEEYWFKFAALHYEHNHNLKWNCKTFFGHDGIQQEHISIHNGNMVMYTSHIAGNWNHNVWNEQNYEQLRISLNHLFENYTITPKFLKECL